MQIARRAVLVTVAFLVGTYYFWCARATGQNFLWGYDLGGYYNYLARGFAGAPGLGSPNRWRCRLLARHVQPDRQTRVTERQPDRRVQDVQLGPAELNLRPARIGWDSGAGIFVTTADRRTIIFGRSENLDDKLAILGTLLKEGAPFRSARSTSCSGVQS